MSKPIDSYFGHRYLVEIVSHVVWFYYWFTLSAQIKTIDE